MDTGVTPTNDEWVGNDPYVFVKHEHEAGRSWRSQEQKALVIGSLLEQSGVWLVEQRRIQAEANRKRAEATKQQHEASKPRHGETMVVPHIEARPKEPKNRVTESKANLIGVNRAAVERANLINNTISGVTRISVFSNSGFSLYMTFIDA